ncbi:MAG TPA: prolyl oligopeptidase family serine peptidase [Bryobacteraceae bacterium]|jgi:prolyl oligopeptidase|nr:prolyl oligopeptidase family serine peptidase [Bryobacteraceae bacterium]
MPVARTSLLIGGMTLLLSAQTAQHMAYPPAPRTNQVDDYHGVKVADPYRSLENADAASTVKWVDRENALTFSWLAKIPGREKIRTQLTSLWNYEKFTKLFKAGGHYFYFHNSGLQNQPVLYVTESLNGHPREFIDPNTYRKDGTVALTRQNVSWNGKLMAYAVAQAGTDWNEWHVRDIETGKDLPDVVSWSKDGTAAWAPDDHGFYYTRFPEPPPDKVLTAIALNEKIYFHKLGDPQKADKLLYERPDHPDWTYAPQVMEGGKVMIIWIESSVPGVDLLAWVDLAKSDPTNSSSPVKDLVTKAEHSYYPIEIADSLLYLRTNDGAPRGRVIGMDLRQPDRSHWKQIVPEREETLEDAVMAGGRLVLSYMKDAHSTARLVTFDGKPVAEIAMPGLGTAEWSPARLRDEEMFYRFAGYTIPPGYYRLDLRTGKTNLVRQGKVNFDAAAYETKQIFYKSKDGTRIPMFISSKKGLKLDGSNPTILYGYGGFDIAETPNFQPYIAEWMQMGGIWAVATLRGGSEYGEAWHQAGMRGKKQNVFDDFIAAAEALIAEKYTSTPKLAIYGASNGGLLVGAVLNQRPDLFGAAMPSVGVMDMLRFNKFGFGAQWTGEYGTPENPEDFKILRAYSPLHNIRKTQYPPVLITTADHDDRVMPGHSLKYAATLQQAQEGSAPILIRIETRAGHGAGKPTSKQIGEWTDRFAFLESALKMNFKAL